MKRRYAVLGAEWVVVRFGARGVQVRAGRGAASGDGDSGRGRGAGRGGVALARRRQQGRARCLLPPAPLILSEQNLADSDQCSLVMDVAGNQPDPAPRDPRVNCFHTCISMGTIASLPLGIGKSHREYQHRFIWG